MRIANDITQLVGGTPLVRLRTIVPAGAAQVLAKLEFFNPGGSVKDRIAVSMIDAAEAQGLLKPGMTVVEPTSGNTGIALAMVCAARGYRSIFTMPETMSKERRMLLRGYGAELVLTPGPDGMGGAIARAKEIADEGGHFMPQQFENPANPAIHAATTAEEIWSDTDGTVDIFVAGVGTGGTLTGVGRRLKASIPGVLIVLADPQGSGLAGWVEHGVAGPDAAYQVEGIGAARPSEILDRSVIDEAMVVSDDESFALTRRLIREEGMLVGGSSGTAVAAALRVAARDLGGPVVALLPDAWDRYRSKPWMRAFSAP